VRSLSIPQQPTGGVRPNARQNDQINPSTTIPTTQVPAAVRSSRLSCGKVGKAQNIHLSSGVIWGIPAKSAQRCALIGEAAGAIVICIGNGAAPVIAAKACYAFRNSSGSFAMLAAIRRG